MTPSPQTHAAPRPIPVRRALALGVLALFGLLVVGTVAALLFGQGQPAEAQADQGGTTLAVLGAGDKGVTLEEPAAGIDNSAELLLSWAPGQPPFLGRCATPFRIMARYAHGPQYRRVDCDHDGAADLWALAEQVGDPELPIEDDSHLREPQP